MNSEFRRHHFYIFFAVQFLLGAILMLGPTTTSAQTSNATDTTTAQPTETVASTIDTPMQTEAIAGNVLKVSGNVLTVETDAGAREFTIPNNIKVTRNGMNAAPDSMRPNDNVAISVGPNGEIFSIESTAAAIVDARSIALPVIIGLALLVPVFYIAIKRSQTGHFKTSSTRLG